MGSRGMTRSTLRATALALAVVVLASCGSGSDVDLDDDAAWRTSTAPVETAGLSWAVGATVHLSDGTTVDAGGPIREFVVAGDGVFFVPAAEGEDEALFEEPLWFVSPDGEPEDTGLEVTRDHFATSPDGRYLTVLDADTDEGSAVMRIFDLDTGECLTGNCELRTRRLDPSEPAPA